MRTVLKHSSSLETEVLKLVKLSTAQRIKIEAGQLVTLRGRVEWSERAVKSVAYMTDKTTKGQLEFISHKLVLSPNNEDREKGSRTIFTLGPIAGGKADDTFIDLRDLLTEQQRLGKQMGLQNVEETYSVIIIKARLSDRAATEMKTTKLCEVKTEELEQLLQQWDDMSQEEKDEKIVKARAFTCGAHKLTNMAESMNKASAKFLYSQDDGQVECRGVYGAKRHIYETDKLLCEQSHKEYAKGKDFKAFCLAEDVHQKSGAQLFKPIVGSRYLIFFHNSIPTYVGREFIQLYLIDLRDVKGHWNRFEASVYEGYSDPRILAEERAYAILYHEVWLTLMVKTKSVQNMLEMNDIYDQSVQKLQEWSQNSESLFEGSERLSEMKCIKPIFWKLDDRMKLMTWLKRF
ncbi:uncharacterized protein [Ptychodera flava]|uniref:uncharacterized protein isoform X2 n=1 Tax=Ptychodera flava TaxID=63121 RepID=UPI00396A70A0